MKTDPRARPTTPQASPRFVPQATVLPPADEMELADIDARDELFDAVWNQTLRPPVGVVMMVTRVEPEPRFRVVHMPAPAQMRLPSPVPAPMPLREMPAPMVRCLFPPPGQKRTVALGDFKAALAHQLARPDALQSAHRLACCVQVFETNVALPLAAIAKRAFGAQANPQEFVVLDAAIARTLHLPPALQSPALPPTHAADAPLPAGARVVHLRVLHDPTHAIATPPVAPQPTVMATPASVPAPAPAAATPSPPQLRTTIPERYLDPRAFALTRDQALIAMGAASAPGVLNVVARKLARHLAKDEVARWRASLVGALDDQLWNVRPPRTAFVDRTLRDWAARALAAAGYDVRAMLPEWELYWRRKGL
jgi:hypothetical protein